MSYSQMKSWSKNELKNRLLKMGISIDKNEHDKSYYEKLYLEQMNAKNKFTRNNNYFGRKQLLNIKRERKKSKEKEEEQEQDNSITPNDSIENNDEEIHENNSIKELNDSDESNQETEGKKISNINFSKMKTKDIIELNKNYKESGIKYTRLIQMKKSKNSEKKILSINQVDNSAKKSNSHNKKSKSKSKSKEKNIELFNTESINDNSKRSPLKRSKNKSQKIKIENNEFLSQNKNIENTPLTDNKEKSLDQEQKPILFGAPKTSDNNSHIFLSQGPISFGVNQSTNSKNLGNTESNKGKSYNLFVKNISDAVKDNLKESQNSAEKKAKTILLKWESPKQKEFMRRSMDLENNSDNNNINISYNFNERLKNYENENINLRNPNQIHGDDHKKGLIIDDNNQYKSKHQIFDDNNNNKILFNYDNNQEGNYNSKLNRNNLFGNLIQNNVKNPVETNYIEAQDIYGKSYHHENINFNPRNPNNNRFDQNIYESDNINCDINYNNNEYVNNFNKPNVDINNDYYQETLEDKIRYEKREENIDINNENEKDIYESDLEIKKEEERIEQQKNKGKWKNKISRIKNNVMNRFRNNAYVFPLILLIVFGIVYFLNDTYERFENYHIIIVFSILMGLLVLFNIIRYFLRKRNYKKMAKSDRIALLDLLNNNNITKEELGNNMILISNFISQRIKEHNITQDEYMKYVFHYLNKYLKKDGFELNINENNNQEYWKEI